MPCRELVRMWGWKENAAEVKADEEELSALRAAGKPLYGESDLPPYVQGVAHRNSLWSQVSDVSSSAHLPDTAVRLTLAHSCPRAVMQLKFGVLPWLNLVNHPYHTPSSSPPKEE